MTSLEYLELLKKEYLKASDDYLEIHSLIKSISPTLLKDNRELQNRYLLAKNKWQESSKKLEELLEHVENMQTNQEEV